MQIQKKTLSTRRSAALIILVVSITGELVGKVSAILRVKHSEAFVSNSCYFSGI